MNRVALVLALILALAPAVVAQGNSTSDSTNATSPTPTNSTAPAGPPAPIEITLVGHDDNGQQYWTLEGKSDHNPTLNVEPGQQVTFHIKAVTGTHNFQTGKDKASKIFSEGDPAIDVVWTAPAEAGTVTYLCSIHATTMKGTIQVGKAAAPGASGGGAGAISGETVDLGDLGHPECAGTKIPAIAAKGVTGGPTVDDYVKSCKSGSVIEGRPASGADYVIPASLALIALGIVGVVWVHRAYKP